MKYDQRNSTKEISLVYQNIAFVAMTHSHCRGHVRFKVSLHKGSAKGALWGAITAIKVSTFVITKQLSDGLCSLLSDIQYKSYLKCS